MQILLNELTLHGQFADKNEFVNIAVTPFIRILKEMRVFEAVLFKKSDVWEKMVTPTDNLHSILTSKGHPDEVRRFKSAMANLLGDPFWDNDSKQDPGCIYYLDGNNISGSSPAEACERDNVIVSFKPSNSSSTPLNIDRSEVIVPLLNLTSPGELREYLWSKKKITFQKYVQARFSVGKLDFSNVEKRLGFDLVQQSDQQSLFIDTFAKFEKLAWEEIYKDKGLCYKEYSNDFFGKKKTQKFRASQKLRCHGYRDNESFVVMGFEVDHKLSDDG